MSDDYVSIMRPQAGKRELYLPVTFDYSGGRRDKQSSAKIWAVAISIVGLIVGIGTMFNKERFFLVNMALGVVIIVVFSFIVRFLILKEGKYRREFLTADKNKMKFSTKNVWGIHSIGLTYPYICRFRNGKSGIYVRLNKDVVLGKYSESEYDHYEAIADAYNLAGGSKIQMCYVDYMSDIGKDERLDESFISLKSCENVDLKDLLTDIFSYQKELMLERVTTYDVYLFRWSGSDISAWNTIQDILSCFMQANYRSYQILSVDDLRELPKEIFRLKEFSAVSAMMDVFDTDVISRVVPISIQHADGTIEKLGKTIQERKEERELQEKKEDIRRKEKKASKKKDTKKDENIDWDEEINPFE